MTDVLPDLESWLHYISTQHHKDIALGLSRSAEVAARMQVLPLAPRQLIVAGTNGKGSTVRFAESLLLAQGLSVGTTMSPHLHRYNERVRLNGHEASDQQLVDAFAAVESVRGDIPLTYYEYSVLGAFWLFHHAKLDVCVLEVGLGGRLDTINVVDAQVSAVTSIGLDHQNFLGDTLELIGAEKAAVCRPDRPLLLGDEMPDSVTQVAEKTGAQVFQFGQDFWYQRSSNETVLRLDGGEITLPLRASPRVALRNATLAVACVGLLTRYPTEMELMDACGHCEHPGRFEVLNFAARTLVVDVAHNAASAAFLGQQLRQRWPERPMVACCGFLADKDVEGIVEALASQIEHWVFVPTGGLRGLSAEDAASRAGSVLAGRSSIRLAKSVAQGLEQASALAGQTDIIAAFGSFLQVQRVRELCLA